ncbi:MAG TPA: DinB family protein [Thermoanaerobaculia bacterium]|nr:DinB family protein [Thermoanaerobaculia bacterium]
MIERPGLGEYADFYAGYIAALPPGDILEILERQKDQLRHLAETVTGDQETFRYAPGKWSVREVLGHVIDGERVFSYRALRFSRGDETPLPSFDENFYVDNADFDSRTLKSLIEEMILLRSANVLFFRELGPEKLTRVGVANTYPVSVRALAFILAGHLQHHLNGLRERYGIEVQELQATGPR